MPTTNNDNSYKAKNIATKKMSDCPFCGEKPKKAMANMSQESHYSVLQKCKNGHIWRSLFATDTKLDTPR